MSWRGHVFKAGVDLVRLREKESFFFDSRGDPDVFPSFSGGLHGGQASVYMQDHFSPFRNLTRGSRRPLRLLRPGRHRGANQPAGRTGLSLRPDEVGAACRLQPLLLSPAHRILAAGQLHREQCRRSRSARRQRARLHARIITKWDGRRNCTRASASNSTPTCTPGTISFENHEISISPHLRAHQLPHRPFQRRGTRAEHEATGTTRHHAGASSTRVARHIFYGPITGGFAGDEPLVPGERIVPAFDQTHTGTAQIFYHNRWRAPGRGAPCATAAAPSSRMAPACRNTSPPTWPPGSMCGTPSRAASTSNLMSPMSPTAFTRSRRKARRFPSSTLPRARWAQPEVPLLGGCNSGRSPGPGAAATTG